MSTKSPLVTHGVEQDGSINISGRCRRIPPNGSGQLSQSVCAEAGVPGAGRLHVIERPCDVGLVGSAGSANPTPVHVTPAGRVAHPASSGRRQTATDARSASRDYQEADKK